MSAGSSYFDRLVRGAASAELADLTDNPLEKLALFAEAESRGYIVQGHLKLAALKQAREDFGWTADFAPPSLDGFRYCIAAAELGCAESSRILGEAALSETADFFGHGHVLDCLYNAAALGDHSAPRRIGEVHEGEGYFERSDSLAFQAFDEATAAHFEHLATSKPEGLSARLSYIGDLAFDDQGFGFSDPWKLWTFANIHWLKAAGSLNPFAASVRLSDLPPLEELDDDGAAALVKVARSLMFGLGLRRDVKIARHIWRCLYKRVSLARSLLWKDWVYFRHLSPERLERIRRVLSAHDESETNPSQLWSCFCISRFNRKSKLEKALDHLIAKQTYHAPRTAFLVDTLLFDLRNLPTDVVERLERMARASQRLQTDKALLDNNARTEIKVFRDRLLAAMGDGEQWSKLLWPSQADVARLVAEIQGISGSESPKLLFLSLLEELSRLRGDREADLIARIAKEVQLRSSLFQAKFDAIRPVGQSVPSARSTLRSAFDAVRAATVDIGPDLNKRDALGFPLPERAADHRSLIERRLTRRGWDRVYAIELSPRGFRVVKAKPSWPAAGFVDTEIRCLTELESWNAEKEVQPRVQA